MKVVGAITDKILAGGQRLLYQERITSGRLEYWMPIPPMVLPYGLVIGIIAGGEIAIQRPVETRPKMVRPYATQY